MLFHLGIDGHGDHSTKLFSSHKPCYDSQWTVFNLSLTILSTSPSNLAKFDFVARFDVSTPAAPFESAFVE